MRSYGLYTALALLLCTTSAFAQSTNAEGSSIKMPKACEATAAKMEMPMPSGDQMGQMTATQKKLHEAMMKMQPAMMQGMMAKDADVAWICAMIPHHQGAIDMARAGLDGADNPESKKLAEETITSNEREIAKLTKWVNSYADGESR